ncbi:MAG: TlpA family protein disulfide reductase [Planctomycetota bacterium]|nr:MAG: TlpA family protein disulfide reductase [Planctomycetota bacterium]
MPRSLKLTLLAFPPVLVAAALIAALTLSSNQPQPPQAASASAVAPPQTTTAAEAQPAPTKGAEHDPSASAAKTDPLIDPAWLEGAPAHRAKVDPLMGKPAPKLEVDSWLNTPRPLTLDQLKGKTVVLFFWSPTCHTCQRIMPALNNAYLQASKLGIEFIGVCTSSQAPLYATGVEQHNIPFPTALDRNGATWKAYGADGTPDFYIIDKDGVLRVADASNNFALRAAAVIAGLVKPDQNAPPAHDDHSK